MKKSPAEVIREYGPFPGAENVGGVTHDGQRVWFASGGRLNALDPASGETLRSIDVAAHAGTAFDGRHLFQIAEDRIQKIDPETGDIIATIPAPGGGERLRACLGRRVALGRGIQGAEDPSGRSADRCRPSHHRKQPLRHRCHLGRWRTLARHLGKRRERIAARRPSDGRGSGNARHACRHRRLGARVRWWRSILLRWGKQRQGKNRPPAPGGAPPPAAAPKSRPTLRLGNRTGSSGRGPPAFARRSQASP